MYVQFYNKNTNKQESALEVRRSTGLDPETVGPVALSSAGIFPIRPANQPFNTFLYTVVVSWDTSTGEAVKSWTPTAKTLADIKEDAKRIRKNSITGRILQLRRFSNYGTTILRSADGIDDSVRPSRFDKFVDRISAAVAELDTHLTTVDSATTVDQINDIVSPAHGAIKIGLDPSNPLNLVASDFELFYSKNYSESDMELYFPSTNTTVAYSSGFAATASVVTEDDPTVQIRVASTGVIVDELGLDVRDVTAPNSNLEFMPFGFQRFCPLSFKDVESNPDVIYDYRYQTATPTEYVVTVSNGRFHIDGGLPGRLTFIQGQKYRFIQEDASNAGHPLLIYKSPTKEIEVTARVITAGTPGSAGAYTEFIPGAVGEVSFECSVHDSMGGYIDVLSPLDYPSGAELVDSPY